ncbi:hypothetical protein MHOCP_07190 [Moorella humiferrea]|uniref:hypothetical protein n=1 Tax=Neomoorella humiferrea TaxID=676965 RepID=UPI0030D48F46
MLRYGYYTKAQGQSHINGLLPGPRRHRDKTIHTENRDVIKLTQPGLGQKDFRLTTHTRAAKIGA